MKTGLRAALMVFLCLAVLAMTGCQQGEQEREQWVRHENPLGFTVLYPRGGRVETSDDGRVVIRLADGESLVAVQPFLMSGPQSAEEWLRDLPDRFSFLFPDAQSGTITPVSGDVARSQLTYGQGRSAGIASVVCAVNGSTGMLYTIAAPKQVWESQHLVLQRVASSFAYTMPRVTNDRQAQPYSVWTDPNEGMFQVEIPEGWETEGGLFRLTTFDTRLAVESARPDGKARVIVGDRETPPYAVLTQQGAALGMTEGMTLPVADGTKLTLRPYAPGLDYAREYVQKHLAADLPNVTFTALKELPDVAKGLQAARTAPSAITPEVSVGSVAFAATKNGRPFRGYCLVGTALRKLQGMDGAVWTVDALYGYVAEAEAEAEAQEALYRMTRTLRVHPDWVVRQSGLVGRLAESVAGTGEAVADALRTALRRLTTLENVSNMTFGMSEHRETATGTVYRRATSGKTYWQRVGGTEQAVPLGSL